jgi:hypothetical protein
MKTSKRFRKKREKRRHLSRWFYVRDAGSHQRWMAAGVIHKLVDSENGWTYSWCLREVADMLHGIDLYQRTGDRARGKVLKRYMDGFLKGLMH